MRCFILRLSCFERIKGLSFELDVDVSYSEMVDMEKVEGFNELIDEKLFEEPCCEVSSWAGDDWLFKEEKGRVFFYFFAEFEVLEDADIRVSSYVIEEVFCNKKPMIPEGDASS